MQNLYQQLRIIFRSKPVENPVYNPISGTGPAAFRGFSPLCQQRNQQL